MPSQVEPSLQPQRTFDYAPGVRINYEVHGRGQKPVVFLHGFAASLETWRDIQAYLEPHLLLYLVDLKGFGFSSKPDDGRYSIEDQASIIEALLERLELTGVCLVGHSYGGAVALITCLKLAGTNGAGRIGSLVLIGSPAASQRLPFFISPLTNPLLRPFLYRVPARQRARYVLRRIVYDGAQVTEQRVERYARFLELPGSYRALAAVARQMLPKDFDSLAARLGTVRAPTLIISGEQDRVVPVWQAERLKTEIPDSKLVIIPKCGHMPPEEHPEETAREILGFLGA